MDKRNIIKGLGALAVSLALGVGAYFQIAEMIDHRVHSSELRSSTTEKAIASQDYDNFNRTLLLSARIEVEVAGGQGLGSGTLVAPNKILTAHHVLFGEDGMRKPEKITVVIGGKRYNGKVGKQEMPSDLASVTLDESVPEWKGIRLSCDDKAVTKEEYYAIGHPHGMDKVVRYGHLAASGWAGTPFNPFDPITEKASFELFQNLFKHRYTYDIHLQPGNSGGGMFDSKGNLVGVVSSVNVVPALKAKGFAIVDGEFSEIPVQVLLTGGFTYVIKASTVCSFIRRL